MEMVSWYDFENLINKNCNCVQLTAVTICNSDYNITNYNLLCPFDNQFIFVNQIQALYSTTATSCNAAPNLVLNVSTNAVYTVCQFCRYRQPCVIAAPLILQNGLFNSSVFNQQTLAPYNIQLSYLCLSKLVIFIEFYRIYILFKNENYY